MGRGSSSERCIVAAAVVLSGILLAGTGEASPTVRFVVGPDVPVDGVDTFGTVASALTTSGLASGAVIEIEPDAPPALLPNSAFAAAQAAAPAGFTIRGNPAFAAGELEPLQLTDAVTISAPDVHLENLHLRFAANAKLIASGARTLLDHNEIGIDAAVAGGAIELNGPSATVLANRILSSGDTFPNFLVLLRNAATESTIADNFFAATFSLNLLAYEPSATPKNDLIAGNTFRGPRGNVATALVFIPAVSNVTIRDNVLIDDDFAQSGIALAFGCQNIDIRHNRISLTGSPDNGISLALGSNAATSLTIAGNDVDMGTGGAAIFLASPTAGLAARIEGNRLRARTGIYLFSNGGTLSDVDLGGGSRGSLGGNDFRAFTATATNTAAAVLTAGSPTETVAAANNVFAGDAETAVFDHDDDPTRAGIATTPALAGNAAYVAALYARFLGRAADPEDPADAGGLVGQLDGGAKAAKVVAQIVRSPEAVGSVVDTAYRSILGRAPTADERAAGITRLAKKKEEDLLALLFASAEARGLFASDGAFVTELFGRLLGRLPSADELTLYAKIAAKKRSKVVAAILKTGELGARRATLVFRDLLRRDPTPEELRKLQKQDRLKLLTTIAATTEFQTGG